MTFLEALQAHKGSLIRLKTELYWYDGRGWDESPGQICLLLDAANVLMPADASTRTDADSDADTTVTDAYLLIDGSPHWVWVADKDVELL